MENGNTEETETMTKPLKIKAETAAEASRIYCEKRDASGKGGGEFPNGEWNGLHISYNGRIWRNAESWKTERPIYDNR